MISCRRPTDTDAHRLHLSKLDRMNFDDCPGFEKKSVRPTVKQTADEMQAGSLGGNPNDGRCVHRGGDTRNKLKFARRIFNKCSLAKPRRNRTGTPGEGEGEGGFAAGKEN